MKLLLSASAILRHARWELAHAEPNKRGIGLASNQVQINLLHRKIESNEVRDTARRLGGTLIAHSPLRSGILTAKFHDPGLLAKVPRMRRILFAGDRDRTVPLIDWLRQIAVAPSTTVSHIGLAWLTTYYGDTVVASLEASLLSASSEKLITCRRPNFDPLRRTLGF